MLKLLIPDKTIFEPGHPSNVNRTIFGPVIRETGIHIRPHMLRHYFATKALEDNMPDMTVMHWLGHKNMSTTNAYTRPTDEGAKKVINGMNEKLFGPIPKLPPQP